MCNTREKKRIYKESNLQQNTQIHAMQKTTRVPASRTKQYISSTRTKRKIYQGKRRWLAQSPYSFAWPSTRPIHTVETKIEPTINYFASSTTAPYFGSYVFRLTDLPDLGAYQAVYDFYKFNYVTAIITPATSASLPGVTPGFAPLITVIDLDDASTPTSYQTLLGYTSSMIHPNVTGTITRYIPVRGVGVSWEGSSATGRTSQKGQWIDMSTPDVSHYGFKLCVRQATTTLVQSYYIIFKYSVSFRSTR